MKLKVGDIINHKNLGLMLLTEKLDGTNTLFKRHENKIFRMIRLFGDNENSWLLYDKTVEAGKIVRLATDDDIIEELTYRLCNFEIDVFFSFQYIPTEDLFLLDTHGESIVIRRDHMEKLTTILKEFL